MQLNETKHLRPTIHFSPAKNWMNDPNGMFYLDGQYHLFFQYNPTGDVWGNIHWGHAISSDLLHWQEQEIGLFAEPEGLGYIFSGGAVVDHNNTSGFKSGQLPAIVATFTNQTKTEVQHQSIAFSNDGGTKWQMYANNPVIENPGIKDFRDPKVIWHKQSNRWIKSLAVGQCIQFFCSTDLKSWQYLSEFGQGFGCHQGVWECPDLFPLNDQHGETKWVLLVSLSPGGPNGGSATQYFVGDFDGEHFKTPQADTLWIDYGTDNYAGVTWDNTPDSEQRRIFIGWMSNWLYAKDVPTNPWRSSMTMPRCLSLHKSEEHWLIASNPADEIKKQRQVLPAIASKESRHYSISSEQAIDIELTIDGHHRQQLELLRLTNNQCQSLSIALNLAGSEITLERGNSGWTHDEFSPTIHIPIAKNAKPSIHCRVIIDNGSIEVFWDHGLVCATVTFFPDEAFNLLAIVPDQKAHIVKQCNVFTVC